MKRTFAFVIAIMMLMTLSIGVFADTTVEYRITEIYDEGFLLDEDERYVDFNEPANDSVPYGETVYYPLLSDSGSGGGYVGVYESAAAKSIRIRTDWDEGSSYINKLSVVKKRYHGSLGSNIDLSSSKYLYFLSISIKQRSTTTTARNDVYGTVKLKKSGDYGFDYDDMQIDLSFEVGYTAPEDSNVIPIDPALFIPDEDFDEYDEETFDFEADDNSYFVVNTNTQKKVVLGLNTDYDDDIGNKYPTADMYFFNGNGGSFNKLGYLYLYSDDTYKYVYSIDDNDDLHSVRSTYDSYDDCFVVRTRKLGRYVLSNIKLAADLPKNNDDATVIYDNDTKTNHNPGTGGYGFDDIAYNGWNDTSYTAPVAAPAVVTPAVITPSSSGESSFEQAASSGSQAAEEPKKDDDEKIADVSKKNAVNVSAAPAATVSIGSDDGDSGLNTRMMLLVACCVGAIASAIGLIICACAGVAKSRSKYY